MDFEHVGVKTTEFMAATSECRKKLFLAACDCRPQYTLAGGGGGSSFSCCFTSDLLHHVVAVNGKRSEACRCGVLNAS